MHSHTDSGGLDVCSVLEWADTIEIGNNIMPSEVLQYVAVTSGGRAFDIDFPLHPQTQSAAAVSELITRLLAAITAHAGDRTDVSDGDILQALAMTSAIRSRMLEADQEEIANLNRALNEQAWLAVNAASAYTAARA